MQLPGADILVRYAHAIDSPDRVASVLRRQRVRADAFTAVAAPDGATAQATIMFESTDRTAARVVALLRPPGRGARSRGVDR